MEKSDSNHLTSEGTLLHPEREDYSHRRSENYFNEPRINRIKSLQDNLQDIKNCVPQDIKDIEELSQRTKEILLKTASSKLNFKSKETVYKNLPTLELIPKRITQRYEQPFAGSSSHDEKKKLKEMQLEYYTKLIREHEEPTMRDVEVTPLPNEDDFFGLTKYSEPNLLTSKKREESRRFLNSSITSVRNDNRVWEEDGSNVDLDDLIRLAIHNNKSQNQ